MAEESAENVSAFTNATSEATQMNEKEKIRRIIDQTHVVFERMGERCMVMHATLPNDYELVVYSATNKEGRFNPNVAKKICWKKLEDKLWELEAYAESGDCYKLTLELEQDESPDSTPYFTKGEKPKCLRTPKEPPKMAETKEEEEKMAELKKMLEKFKNTNVKAHSRKINIEDIEESIGKDIERKLKEIFPGAKVINMGEMADELNQLENMLDEPPTPGCDCFLCQMKKDYQEFKRRHGR